MDQQIIVGITGGIGAGKSTVCRIIHTMGYPVFYSDDEARKLLNSDPELRASIEAVFGPESYLENGHLNRPFIAKKVFSNQQLLDAINGLVHPVVRKAFDQWASAQDSSIVFNEAAIIFETGSYKNNTYNVLVTSPVELRISRVMERDNITEEAVRARMDKQWTDEQKAPLSDFIIRNNDTDMLIPQVLEFINKIK